MSEATGGHEPPSTGLTTVGPPSNETGATGSGHSLTTDAAKEQAEQVGETTMQATSQVASSAADQAKNVATETKRQAQELMSQAGTQAQEQATAQMDKAAAGLRSVAEELRSLADGGGTQNEMITGLTHQVADKTKELADWLEQRDPADLLEEVRSLARRKPGTFLLGAALAGVAAGRMTRGLVASQSGSERADTSPDAWTSATSTYGQSTYGPSAFGDASDVFAASESAFASEAPSVTMPSAPVVVGQERAGAGSEFASGSSYGEGSR